jgi:hypothetical protein
VVGLKLTTLKIEKGIELSTLVRKGIGTEKKKKKLA